LTAQRPAGVVKLKLKENANQHGCRLRFSQDGFCEIFDKRPLKKA